MSQCFFIWCPDYPDSAPRRAKVRAQHLEEAKLKPTKGLLGGPLIDTEGNMKGSASFVYAESEEQVWETVKGDIYYREGVWDKEHIAVWPYRPAAPPNV